MSEWISVEERPPGAEERVLVCVKHEYAGKVYKHVVAGMHEDGTVWREESSWNFNNLDDYGTYDEEQDDWKIPEGWWEYTIYNEDEGNYKIDGVVTHGRPMPAPPKEATP